MGFSLESHQRHYHISLYDGFLSLVSGLSGLSYAHRHRELATKKEGESSLPYIKQIYWHKTMACLEILPLIGSGVALIERFVFLAYSWFSTKSPDTTSILKIEPTKAKKMDRSDVKEVDFDALLQQAEEQVRLKEDVVQQEPIFFSGKISQGAIAVTALIKEEPEKIGEVLKRVFQEGTVELTSCDGTLASATRKWNSFSATLEEQKGNVAQTIKKMILLVQSEISSPHEVSCDFCFVDTAGREYTTTFNFSRSQAVTPTEE